MYRRLGRFPASKRCLGYRQRLHVVRKAFVRRLPNILPVCLYIHPRIHRGGARGDTAFPNASLHTVPRRVVHKNAHRTKSCLLHDSDMHKTASRQRRKIPCQEMVSGTGIIGNSFSENEDGNEYLARVTIKAFFMVFPLQLTVPRRHCLFFNRQATASTLLQISSVF